MRDGGSSSKASGASRRPCADFKEYRGPLHYAYCDGRSRGLLVYRRWQLALVDSAGGLSDVLVATGLVGL